MKKPHISIVVYKGSPLDLTRYRHTALWFQVDDGSLPFLVEVAGPQGEFVFETRETAKPWESQDWARTIDVGYLTIATPPSQIVQMLERVPIRNRDREFNCHTWVENALVRWKNTGHLSKEAYDKGIDGMVDAISEAEDVEE